MQELEKILEEIIEQLKAEGCIIDNDAGHRAVDIIRKHMDNNNLCEKCSRRKWYQIGYKDGKDTDVPANGGWISVEKGMPEKEYYTALCITDKNHYCVAVYNKEYGFRTGDIDVEGEVIAWRPLPDTYQPERSAE